MLLDNVTERTHLSYIMFMYVVLPLPTQELELHNATISSESIRRTAISFSSSSSAYQHWSLFTVVLATGYEHHKQQPSVQPIFVH